MMSFNRKEYSLLKQLHDIEGWVWMARDKDKTLYVYKEKPTKKGDFYVVLYKWGECWGDFKEIDSEDRNQFTFIDWENEEPTRIKSLIDWFERVESVIEQGNKSIVEMHTVKIEDLERENQRLKEQIECLKFDIQNKDNLIQGLQSHNHYMESLFIAKSENS